MDFSYRISLGIHIYTHTKNLLKLIHEFSKVEGYRISIQKLMHFYTLAMNNPKASILQHSAFFIVQLLHPHMTTGKTIALTRWTFVGKVMRLLFNILSRLITAFLPGSKCLLISWLQSPSAVILEPKKIKSVTVSIVSPSICHEVMWPDAMILVFWMLRFKPAFSLSSFTFIRGSLFPLHFLPLSWCHLYIWGYWYFSWQSWLQLVHHPAQHFTWYTLHIS